MSQAEIKVKRPKRLSPKDKLEIQSMEAQLKLPQDPTDLSDAAEIRDDDVFFFPQSGVIVSFTPVGAIGALAAFDE